MDKQRRTASRFVKMNGFRTLSEVANLKGYHPNSLSRIAKEDPERFIAIVNNAKQLKEAKENELQDSIHR
jgi:mannose-6-phosphate isomerase class I